MAAEKESVLACLHMVSAFRAMEPPDVVISFARVATLFDPRDFGGGSITEGVQSCIWQDCISKADLKWQGTYAKRFLKKLILDIESSGSLVLDELYEQYDDDANQGNLRVLKTISFLFPKESRVESSGSMSCIMPGKLEARLWCSINMLEGDTGCCIWPSSLFLSEFILSSPELFANKWCFEVGSGVGLVGICLSYVKAFKVILSDGDLSTLSTMKVNLELNHLKTGNQTSGNLLHQDMVQCVCLPWESASEDDLRYFCPDVIADIIYDPSCLPHLVRILAVVLKHGHSDAEPSADCQLDDSLGKETRNDGLVMIHPPPIEGRVAYIASVIRNIDTFNCFIELSRQANLIITDLTENTKVSNFLPYMRSYPRSTIRLFKIHL
ncbi:hypothetical protein OROHE_025518 [Orobanche hederae]